MEERDYDLHVDSHSEEKCLKPHICAEVFSEESILLEHLNINSDEKPFLSDTCEKDFMEEKNYVLHLEVMFVMKALIMKIMYMSTFLVIFKKKLTNVTSAKNLLKVIN